MTTLMECQLILLIDWFNVYFSSISAISGVSLFEFISVSHLKWVEKGLSWLFTAIGLYFKVTINTEFTMLYCLLEDDIIWVMKVQLNFIFM